MDGWEGEIREMNLLRRDRMEWIKVGPQDACAPARLMRREEEEGRELPSC